MLLRYLIDLKVEIPSGQCAPGRRRRIACNAAPLTATRFDLVLPAIHAAVEFAANGPKRAVEFRTLDGR